MYYSHTEEYYAGDEYEWHMGTHIMNEFRGKMLNEKRKFQTTWDMITFYKALNSAKLNSCSEYTYVAKLYF